MGPLTSGVQSVHDVPFNDSGTPSNGSIVARVERTLAPTGDELLRGETVFTLRDASTLRVTENARIDGFGRLDRAEISLSYEGSSARVPERVVRETLDPGSGVLSVTRENGRTTTRAVSVALPWIYLPAVLDSGERLATPVAARVALRAAKASYFALELAAFEAEAVIASDQFEVPSETRNWVVLGEDLATFGARGELLTLDVKALGLQIRQQL